jgi:hypothetical protein
MLRFFTIRLNVMPVGQHLMQTAVDMQPRCLRRPYRCNLGMRASLVPSGIALGECRLSGTATVIYSFDKYNLSVTLQVGSPHIYKASDNKLYSGFPIMSGTGNYTGPDGTKCQFIVAPQDVSPYNVLWATPASGNGGSRYGFDIDGITIQGEDCNLAWNQTGLSFHISEGTIDADVMLKGVHPWPPKF